MGVKKDAQQSRFRLIGGKNHIPRFNGKACCFTLSITKSNPLFIEVRFKHSFFVRMGRPLDHIAFVRAFRICASLLKEPVEGIDQGREFITAFGGDGPTREISRPQNIVDGIEQNADGTDRLIGHEGAADDADEESWQDAEKKNLSEPIENGLSCPETLTGLEEAPSSGRSERKGGDGPELVLTFPTQEQAFLLSVGRQVADRFRSEELIAAR